MRSKMRLDKVKILAGLALGLLGTVAFIGCEETTQPSAPPPPPQIEFERYSTTGDAKHRIVDNEVYDVFVDSRNRIWFATDQGVSMKDGTNDVVTFDMFDGIPNLLCRAITELNDSIYVGTWGSGAAVFNETTWRPLPVQAGTAPGLVHPKVSAAVSDGSTLWFGTTAGVSQYRDTPGLTQAQRWTNHSSKLIFGRNVSRMLFQATSRGNEVWVATKDGGIAVIRSFSTTRYTVATTGLPEDEVSGLAYSAPDDMFWVGLATRCVASVDVDNSVWTHYTDVNGFASNLITGVATREVSGILELWMSSQRGLSLRRNNKITNYITGSGLPAELARNIVADRNGEVWACFIGAGAARIKTGYEIP